MCKTYQLAIETKLISLLYSRAPLFRTRLIQSPRYFEGRSNSLGFTLMFSVIYYQLFRTRLFRIPRCFELIVLSLHLKSTPAISNLSKKSTYIRAQLETYCILFELVLRNLKKVSCHSRSTKVLEEKAKITERSMIFKCNSIG